MEPSRKCENMFAAMIVRSHGSHNSKREALCYSLSTETSFRETFRENGQGFVLQAAPTDDIMFISRGIDAVATSVQESQVSDW